MIIDIWDYFMGRMIKYVTDVHTNPYSDNTNTSLWDQGAASINSMGFDSFYVYTRNQMSGEVILEYLNNTRNVNNTWHVNGFRDMARLVQDPRHAGQEIYSNETWISSETPSLERGPLVIEGMSITPNPFYLESSKEWHQKRKFVDKYLNIHLICSNSENVLVTLYSVGTNKRIAYR